MTTKAMKGDVIYTEGKGNDRLVVTHEEGEFVTYVYRNSEGRPELLGTGHDLRSALAFIKLHRPQKRKAMKKLSGAELSAWLGRAA